ncbi:hypothetical protein [Lyngbya confervoides]|uniref:Uncharacterized protein n=1 Tax=Lyngbya confervoides BDU141951 TaxID=1574623 RepID=A0ABD4T115_9CYAN|nr:hypothetical protein [Lyngbya confervoides]MCM1982461.1 hypothetical protein [Lyngbya confervoides BDU141951]
MSNPKLPDFDLDLPLMGMGGNELREVSPPEAIERLKLEMGQVQPQISVSFPHQNEQVNRQDVAVQFDLKGLDLFKDPTLNLGPHLVVWLDGCFLKEIYRLDTPLQLEDLKPGNHILQMAVAYPWHESFRNPGAHALVSFSVWTETQANQVKDHQPVLRVSPLFGDATEPLLLDLRVDRPGETPDQSWVEETFPVRVTLNGTSFIATELGPIYLSGLREGDNWLKVELLDAQGQELISPYPEQTFSFTYAPSQSQTPLAQLMQGNIPFSEARAMIDPAVSRQVEEAPDPSVTPSPNLPRESPSSSRQPMNAVPQMGTPSPSLPMESPAVTLPENEDSEPVLRPSQSVSPQSLPTEPDASLPSSSPLASPGKSGPQDSFQSTAPTTEGS